MINKGVKYLAKGGLEIAYLENEDDIFTLKQLQEHVGGYIKIIQLSFGLRAVINDEAKEKGLEYNIPASNLCKQPIYGDVLMTDYENLYPKRSDTVE